MFVELSALLYVGVLSVVGGLGLDLPRIRRQSRRRRHLFDPRACWWPCLRITASLAATPYDNGEVESPSLVFDYVLYFACLMFSATLAFIETRFAIFGGWYTHLLIASIAFGVLAYRFDNRFVLSLALSTLAGYLGLKIEPSTSPTRMSCASPRWLFGASLAGLGVWLHRQGIKPHFLDTFVHIGANVIMMATISGVPEPDTGWLYLAALLALSAAAIYLGVRFSRFAFVAYGTLYGYAGISVRLLDASAGRPLALWYFVDHRHRWS